MDATEQIRLALHLDRDWRIVVDPERVDEAQHLCPGVPGPGGMPLSDWVVLRSELTPDGLWRVARCAVCKTLRATPAMG
jgi:hypothetical protein